MIPPEILSSPCAFVFCESTPGLWTTARIKFEYLGSCTIGHSLVGTMNEKSELESKQPRQYEGSKFPSQPKRPRGPRTRKVGVNEVGQANYATEYVLPLRSPADAQISSNTAAQETTITDFAKLSDGTLLELVEDPTDAKRTLLALWQKRQDRAIQYVTEFRDGNKVFVPRQRRTQVLKSVRLPNRAVPYYSANSLWEGLEKFISQCVDVREKYIPLIADFILTTWFVDRFQVAPYLSVVGLPQSGKTTLLKLLVLLCRRPLLLGDITESSLYHACSDLMPTILIDECGTIKNNRALRHLLRIGTTREAVCVRGDQVLQAYGPKVVSWIEPPDDLALNSRFIQIPMSETTRNDLQELKDPKVEETADTLRAQLLQYRLENYHMIRVDRVNGDDVLRPRTRDIVQVLSAPTFQNPARSKALLKLIASGEAVPQEALNPEQNAVVRALFSISHGRENYYSLQTGKLTEAVNLFLKLAGEHLRMQPRKVGAVLTSLGFCNRTRTNSGWVITLNRGDVEKVHHLAECYGIHNVGDPKLVVWQKKCPLCRATAEKNGRLDPGLPEGMVETSLETLDVRKELGI